MISCKTQSLPRFLVSGDSKLYSLHVHPRTVVSAMPTDGYVSPTEPVSDGARSALIPGITPYTVPVSNQERDENKRNVYIRFEVTTPLEMGLYSTFVCRSGYDVSFEMSFKVQILIRIVRGH